MPSFDVVSQVDQHEISNAVDQSNREISTRFDFKGTNARVELNAKELNLVLIAPTEFQLKQIDEILRNKLTKRQVDIRVLDYQDPNTSLNESKQVITIKQGLDSEQAKKIVKIVKEAGLKVQAAIQGDQIRVTGKKRDDLQDVIAFLRQAKIDVPLQFINFRD